MIKYKLKDRPINRFSTDWLRDYLESLGVSKTDSFTGEIDPRDEEDCFKLENMELAIDALHEAFTAEKNFFLQVDSDVDGFTSSAIFYAFFKRHFPNAKITWRLQDEKEHGVFLDTIPIESEIIIIPDAGSSQLDEQEELSKQGRTVIILDHHSVDHNVAFENVILVNNQISPHFKNKNLSGAGVVYKTIQAYSKKYLNSEDYKDFIDLAAVGIVSDMMDTRNLDNNYLIREGLKNIKSPMLLALLEKQAYSIKNPLNPTKIDIAFYIAPIINGVIRFGTDEEKEILFKGFIEYNLRETVVSSYHGARREEDFYAHAARVSYNAKERQNRRKMKSLEYLDNKIQSKKLYENKIIIVEVSQDDVPKSITGLVAMEILKKYNLPALVVRPREIEGEGELWGSGRGKANGDFSSLRDFLRESELCTFAEGHDFAHGVGFKKSNLDKIIEYANDKLEHIDFSVDETEVDFIFDRPSIEYDMVKVFAENNHIYGNMIPQPKFAIDFAIPISEIDIFGRAENIIKTRSNGVEIIKFFAKDLAQQLKMMDSTHVRIKGIGRPQANEWNGRITPQIILDEVEFIPENIEVRMLF